MTASTIDFPMHSRIVEIVDEGNGYLSIYVTNIEHSALEGSLAHLAREIGAGKSAFTAAPLLALEPDMFWRWDVPSQNLLLRMPLPNDVRGNLYQFEWSNTIESLTTLPALPTAVLP